MYFIGLFVMTIGIALSVKSNLGVSPVSSIPYTMTCVWGIEMGNHPFPYRTGSDSDPLIAKKLPPIMSSPFLVNLVVADVRSENFWLSVSVFITMIPN